MPRASVGLSKARPLSGPSEEGEVWCASKTVVASYAAAARFIGANREGCTNDPKAVVSGSGQTRIARRAREWVACAGGLAFGRAGILPGTPTTTVPSSLFDPLGTLTSPLPANEFLLPIEITGASGLQDWSFDLNFTDGVVSPLDVGGLFQSVYQAEFNALRSDLVEYHEQRLTAPRLAPRNCGLLFRC